MNSNQPKWFKDLAQGLIDLHVHSGPCLYHRVGDELDISKDAHEFGYKGILYKNHLGCNAGKTDIVRKILPGFEAHGSLILSSYTGGLNPDAVEAAIKKGAKMIWMPVFHASHHIKKIGFTGLPRLEPDIRVERPRKRWQGIKIIDENNQLLPSVEEILGIISDCNVILGTGHVSIEEIYILIQAARKMGIKKIIVTHAEHLTTGWSVQDQFKLAEMGATIEHCFPSNKKDLIAEALKKIGPKKCIMATDAGTDLIPPPIDTMRIFIREMLDRGISEKDIVTMTQDNPSKLLGL